MKNWLFKFGLIKFEREAIADQFYNYWNAAQGVKKQRQESNGISELVS